MKYPEMSDEDKGKAHKYVLDGWKEAFPLWLGALKRVLNYLFTLNTGGAALCLTYLATKDSNGLIITSLWIFVFGVLFILAHAGWDYYTSEYWMNRMRSDNKEFFDGIIEWDVWLARDRNRQSANWPGHLLGWLSFACFFVGTLLGGLSISIDKKAPQSAPGYCELFVVGGVSPFIRY